MKNLEMNKMAAAILVAGLIVLTISKIANVLYYPSVRAEENEKRGFQIEGAEQVASGETAEAPKAEEKIDVAALMAAANAEAGQEIFKKCAACHVNDTSGKHKVGPNLHGVVGAPVARHADFAYSNGMKEKGGSWTPENLFAFLKKPRDYVAGTKMSFPGLKDPKEIANVVKYLEQN